MKKNVFANRRLKHGTLATVLTIVFIAAVVLVNVIATILLEKFPLNIDLTKEKTYAMAEDSKEFLKNLDTDVKIHVMAEESTLASTGDFYMTQALNTIKQCAQYSPKVSLDFINLEKNPQYGKKEYPGAEINQGSIIVESKLRYKVLSMNDFFDMDMDYTTYQQTVTGSHAENDMLSALMYVTETNPAEIVLLTNNKPIGSEGLQTLLTKNNYSFKEINLMSQDIPADAELVLIAAPTVDYTTKQIEKLEAFMNNNGKYGKQLVYLASSQQEKLPILEGYLANDWGIELGQGMLVETDTQNMYSYQYAPYFGGQTLTGNAYAGKLDTEKSLFVAPFCRPVTPKFETEGGITVKSILTTPDSCVFQPIDAGENWSPEGKEKKAYSTAAQSVRLKYEDGTNKELKSTALVFGSLEFFDKNLVSEKVYANGEFTVQMFNELAGKEENTLNIVPKVENKGKLENVTQATVNVVLIIFVIVVPIAVFATGLIIWFRRRHR